MAALSLAWALAFHGVTGAIVGARTPEQVEGWLEGAELVPDEVDPDEIAIEIRRSGLGAGPARP